MRPYWSRVIPDDGWPHKKEEIWSQRQTRIEGRHCEEKVEQHLQVKESSLEQICSSALRRKLSADMLASCLLDLQPPELGDHTFPLFKLLAYGSLLW